MSWTVIKELKEKRAKVFADAAALRESANKENRDLNADEEKRHADLLAEVENYGKRIAREEQAGVIAEALDKRSQVGREDTENRGNSLGMPEKDFSRYSLLRAIQRRVNNEALDGIEAEVSREIEKRTGKAPQGFYFPTEQRTTLNLTTGAGSIPTILSQDFITILRNKVVTSNLGARFLPNMVGNFAIPKQTQAGTAYWVAEGNAPSTSNQTVGQVTFSAKTVGAYTDLTRKFINQTTQDAEAFVREDLASVLAIELDRVAVHGLGSSNEPLGIIPNLTANYSGQIHAIGTNGGAAAFTDVVALETLVATANADFGKLAYLTNSKVKGALKTTAKSASAIAAGFIWDGNEVNGYNAAVSNIVKSNGTKASGSSLSTMVFGNWDSLVFSMWGGLDILVDPYTGSNAGTVRIVALQDTDLNVRYPESFSAMTDIVA